uniref:CCHC-type domain-containing protein n=1 Tax=Triticum urartu TaxID=4572 RepID=A0A8R7P7T4_TRIUA
MSSPDLAPPLQSSPPAAPSASSSPPPVPASMLPLPPAGLPIGCTSCVVLPAAPSAARSDPDRELLPALPQSSLGHPGQVGGVSMEVPPGKLPASASARLPAPTSPVVSAARLAVAALASRKADPAIGGRMAGTGSTPASLAGVSSSQLPPSSTSTPSSLRGPDQADPSPTSLSCIIPEASSVRPDWGDWLGCFKGMTMPADPICCAPTAHGETLEGWHLVIERRRLPSSQAFRQPAFNARPASPSWLKDRCFRCLSKGHHEHSCRDPIRCRSCLHFGHPARFCRAKNTSHQSTPLRRAA